MFGFQDPVKCLMIRSDMASDSYSLLRLYTFDDDDGKSPETFDNKFHTDNFTCMIPLYVSCLQSFVAYCFKVLNGKLCFDSFTTQKRGQGQGTALYNTDQSRIVI